MLVLRDAKTDQLLSALEAHRSAVTNVAFLEGGKVLASHSEYDGTVCLWRVAAGP